jgi:hypothetical protein
MDRKRRGLVAGSGVATLVAAIVVPVTLLGGSAGAAARMPARPDAHISRSVRPDVGVAKETQEFQKTTAGFCPSGGTACDGAEGDYGTIDRVLSGFSNGGAGNYAPSTTAYYETWMALISGSQIQNQGLGCPNPAVEYCTGPYLLWGSGATEGMDNTFPTEGFTISTDLYLSPTTAGPAGSVIDTDSEINDNTGSYGIDNIITACDESGGFVLNFGHNSPGSCSGTPAITTAGWYRFVFEYTDTAGYAYVTMSVYSDTGGAMPTLTQIATSGPQPVGGGSAERIGDWGGPGYLWWPTEDESGLPLANVALETGQHSTGYTPPAS